MNITIHKFYSTISIQHQKRCPASCCCCSR